MRSPGIRYNVRALCIRNVMVYADETTLISAGIQRLVQQYLPGSADKTPEAITQILKLCTTNVDPYSYDIVLCADREMKKIDVADCDRIARVVCDQMYMVRLSYCSRYRAFLQLLRPTF